MSTGASENIFLYAKLTLASMTSPGSTTTVYLSNRAAELGGNVYKPLIKSVNGIAYGMGAYIPRSTSGSITLDDSPHSFAFERRLSDLLERYSLLDQEVEISFQAGTDLDDHLGSSGSATVIFRGLVLDWRKDVSTQNLTIRIKGKDLSKDVITRTVNSTDFPSAQPASLGKNLPIVFGTDIEVQPVCISADGSTDPEFAYMTTLKDQFISGGIQKYYAKNLEGRFVQVKTPTNVGQALFTNPSGGSTAGLTATYEFLYPFSTEVDGGGIVTYYDPIDLDFYNYVIRIYQQNGPSNSNGELIELGRASNDQLLPFGTPSLFKVVFNRPVILEPNRQYFLGIHSRGGSSKSYNPASGTLTAYRRLVANGDSAYIETVTINRWAGTLYAVKFTETTNTGTDSKGFSYAKFKLDQKDPTTPSKMALDDVSLIVSTHGLKDVNGYIASAGSVITRPDHAIELLTRYYASSTWNNAQLDTTIFSDSTTGVSTSTDSYFRAVGGRTDGRAVASQVIDDIGRSCAVRVAHVVSATTGRRFARWCWSTNRATQWRFTNRNSTILEIEQRDAATVINKATAFYGESLRGLTVENGSAEGGFKNYANVAQTYNGLDTMATALTSESVTIYGERPNAVAGYKWLNSSGRFVTDYLCALFGKPHVYVSLEVPLFADGDEFTLRPYELHCLDVVEILHPELFAYFGTSADPGASTYAGTATDPSGGAYIVRANTYRAQIEGKEFIFSDNESAKIRFTLRLLTNYPSDPT